MSAEAADLKNVCHEEECEFFVSAIRVGDTPEDVREECLDTQAITIPEAGTENSCQLEIRVKELHAHTSKAMRS